MMISARFWKFAAEAYMSQPSRTYELFYCDIIEELFYQICGGNLNYCVQCRIEGDEPAIAIWKKFETYKAKALENMTGSRLDRHKLPSCICGAIIEAKPLTGNQKPLQELYQEYMRSL